MAINNIYQAAGKKVLFAKLHVLCIKNIDLCLVSDAFFMITLTYESFKVAR